MSTTQLSADGLSAAEANLGTALVLIQRALARLDEPGRAARVQADLVQAGACIESARLAHEKNPAVYRPGMAQGSVDSETTAIIAAAIAALLDGPYRLISVRPVTPPGSPLNVWGLEGRTQIFQSHKVR